MGTLETHIGGGHGGGHWRSTFLRGAFDGDIGDTHWRGTWRGTLEEYIF